MEENIGDPENMGLNCVGALTCGKFSINKINLKKGNKHTDARSCENRQGLELFFYKPRNAREHQKLGESYEMNSPSWPPEACNLD